MHDFSRLAIESGKPRRGSQLNVEKLKNKARKFELKDQPDKAIETYLEIIRGLEGTPEFDEELALYNKVGDLYQKVRNVNAAVDIWERAVDRYTDSGFPNNAIALCNKILRSAPGRVHVYLRLAQLMMKRGFVAEAKKNFIEYAERMMEVGKLDDAFRALKQFTDLSPENDDLRAMLYSQLKAAARDERAKAQLEQLMEDAGGKGESALPKKQYKDVDPEYDLDAAQSPPPLKGRSDDLIFISLDDDEPGRGSVAESPPPEPIDIEPTSLAPEQDAVEDLGIISSDSLQIERTSESDLGALGGVEPAAPVDGFEADGSFEAPEEEEEIPLLEIEPTALEPEPATPETPSDEDLSFLAAAEEESVDDTGGESADDDGLLHRTTAGLEVPELDLGGFDASADEEGSEPGLTNVADSEATGETVDEDTDTPVPDVSGHEPYQLPDFEVTDPVEAAALDLPHGGFAQPLPPPSEQPPVEEAAGEDLTEGLEPAHEEQRTAASSDFDTGELRDPATRADELQDVESALFGEDHTSLGDSAAVGEEETIGGELQFIEPESDADAAEAIPAAARVPFETSVATEPQSVDDLESAVGDAPDDATLRRRYAEALIETGDRDRGLSELDRTLVTLEAKGEWGQAAAVTDEILRIEPNSVTHHQKQVEYTYRVGDHSRLVGAYLGLGNALFRSGVLDRARSVYERVLELDPQNKAALQALESVMPDKGETGGDDGATSDFVDLGELILGDEDEPKDTRMRVQEEEPTGDEQQDFREMLEQFKRGIEENLDEEDSQAHYDLGVAFKEMGLIDEAIAEFQKALRSIDTRLQSAEMLGLCFFDKGQIEVAGTVLRRGIEGDPSSDQEKIGLLYWLGRCEEEQNRSADALRYYQRVFSIDIHFLDVGKRVDALVKATR